MYSKNKDRTRRMTILRRGAVGAGLALAVVCAGVPAIAAPDGGPSRQSSPAASVEVSGRLFAVPGSPGVFRVTGGMIGTYRVGSENVSTSWPEGSVSVSLIEGTDMITGCVDRNRNRKCDRGEPNGELQFDFKRLATFDATTGAFIESNCVHPIRNASGSYAGGLFHMRDVATGRGDEIVSTYRGEIVLKS
jgi:hypothetical protein